MTAADLAEAKNTWQNQLELRQSGDDFVLRAIHRGLSDIRTLEFHRSIESRIQALTMTDIRDAISRYLPGTPGVRQ